MDVVVVDRTETYSLRGCRIFNSKWTEWETHGPCAWSMPRQCHLGESSRTKTCQPSLRARSPADTLHCAVQNKHHITVVITVNRLNSLDQETVDVRSINSFKGRLDKIRKTRMGFYGFRIVRKAKGLMEIGPPWGHTKWVTRWVTYTEAIVDGRLWPRCTTHNDYFRSLSCMEQNLVGISAVMFVVFYGRVRIHTTCHRAIMWKHDVIHKTGST